LSIILLLRSIAHTVFIDLMKKLISLTKPFQIEQLTSRTLEVHVTNCHSFVFILYECNPCLIGQFNIKFSDWLVQWKNSKHNRCEWLWLTATWSNGMLPLYTNTTVFYIVTRLD